MIKSVNVTTTRELQKLQSQMRHSKFTPEHVATLFNVGIGTAKDILAFTTQEGIHHAITPMTR